MRQTPAVQTLDCGKNSTIVWTPLQPFDSVTKKPNGSSDRDLRTTKKLYYVSFIIDTIAQSP